MLSDDESLAVVPDNTSGYTESTLSTLAQRQADITSTWWRRCLQFLNSTVLRRPNTFEEYVLHSEPNDCAFVSRYNKVVDLDLSDYLSISVDSLTLNSVHVPHPLVNFAKDEPLTESVLGELEESPIILFIHGLGGQMSQFEPVMSLLSQCLEILALDLPGFGDSRLKFAKDHLRNSLFSEKEIHDITTSVGAMAADDFAIDNLVNIIIQFIRQFVPPNKKLIIVGHSMGTHLLIKLSSKLDKLKVEGMVLLSPPPLHNDIAEPASANKPNHLGFFSLFIMKVPAFFNLFRVWDRLPGLFSTSVSRQLTDQAKLYTRVRQFRWNLDIDTNILLKYIRGFKKATYSELITAVSKFNNNPRDPRTYEKTLLVGGKDDKVTPIRVLGEVHGFLQDYWQRKVSHVVEIQNAGHALLLSKPEFISGLILNHLELNFPERLHLLPAWVLKLKAEISGDKWGMKNEMKWLQTQSISANITRKRGSEKAPLLGMKTLREGDAHHSPTVIEDKFYGASANQSTIDGNLIAIVDISADIPPYSPKKFEKILYYKCATVSKVVPDHVAIRRFIQLIDDIFASSTTENPLIAVHCHYGFNRTGFLICCYLIERLGWSVKEAIDGYRAAKPPGIKHPHFIDALYVRYER